VFKFREGGCTEAETVNQVGYTFEVDLKKFMFACLIVV
jgi:hypothetical protein